MVLILETERASEFFTWFNLDPLCAPVPAAGRRAWHCFRPTGAAFRPMVEVDVLADSAGAIVTTCLGLDRAFIDDRRNGAFARDIGKSFLAWAVRAPSPAATVLVANIANVRASGGPIIMRAPGPEPLAADPTGAYDVFLGKAERVTLARDGIGLANIPGALPPRRLFEAAARGTSAEPGRRWLHIEVRLAAEARAGPFAWLRRLAGNRRVPFR